MDTSYTVSGYAYAGGGIGLTRVEVSFDDGKTWELTEMATPEKPRHMGKYWCWVFWEFKVDLLRCAHFIIQHNAEIWSWFWPKSFNVCVCVCVATAYLTWFGNSDGRFKKCAVEALDRYPAGKLFRGNGFAPSAHTHHLFVPPRGPRLGMKNLYSAF